MTITRRKWVFSKLWLPILLLLHQLGPLQAENSWNSIIAGLTELDGPAFRDQVAHPLVQMSANAYRHPRQVCVDIPGWIPSSQIAPIAPAEGGVHAQVYEVIKPHIQFRVLSHNRAFFPSKFLLIDLLSLLSFEFCKALVSDSTIRPSMCSRRVHFCTFNVFLRNLKRLGCMPSFGVAKLNLINLNFFLLW